ncbi:hypothetical protein T439DRAFT_309129 [Meredithblackwellia eburnea MCA 4105]
MASQALQLTTASCFLEHASTAEFITYSVPSNAPDFNDYDDTRTPILAQDEHALSAETFFPPASSKLAKNDKNGFILARIIEDGFTLELRWLSLVHCTQSSLLEGFDASATLPPVRFVFPSRLVPSPTFSILNLDQHHNQQSLQVYAVTEQGYLYALTFSGDRAFYASEMMEEGGWCEEFKVEGLQGRTPVLVKGVDEGRVVVATKEGTAVGVEVLEDGTLSETDLKSPSISFSVRSLLPSFSSRNISGNFSTSSSSSPSQLLSVASYPTLNFVFGVSRDQKLKIWNLETGGCLKSVDLPRAAASSTALITASNEPDSPVKRGANSSHLLSEEPRAFVKLFSTSEEGQQLYLVLLSPSSSFTVYQLILDSAGTVSELKLVLNKPSNVEDTSQLIDFDLVKFSPVGEEDRWTLWTLWEGEGVGRVRFVGVDFDGHGADDEEDDEGEEWTEVDPGLGSSTEWNAGYFDDLLRDLDLPAPATEEEEEPQPLTPASRIANLITTFTEHILYPGRYPLSSLEYALESYESSLLSSLSSLADRPAALDPEIEFPSLSERVKAVVGCTIRLETSPQTGALLHDLHEKKLRNEWLKFVALANESRKECEFPLRLVVDRVRKCVGVVGRDTVGAVLVMDTVLVLRKMAGLAPGEGSEEDAEGERQLFLNLPPSALERSYPHLAPRGVRHDLLVLLSSISTLSRNLPSSYARQLERTLVERVKTPFTSHVEDIALEIYEDGLEPWVDEETRGAVLGLLETVLNKETSFQVLWSLLTSPEVVQPYPSSSVQGVDGKPSEMAAAILTDAVSTTVEARFHLAVGLVMLLLFLYGEQEDWLVVSPAVGTSGEDVEMTGHGGGVAKKELKLPSFTNSALATLHQLAALRWVIQQTETPTSTSGSANPDDSITLRMGEMKVTGKNGDDDSAQVVPHSLLHSLIRSSTYTPTYSLSLSSPLALTNSLISFLTKTGLLAQKRVVVDSVSDVKFAFQLFKSGLPGLVLQWEDMFPAGAGMKYVVGLASLDLERDTEAEKAFAKAASALYTEGVRLDESSGMSHVLPLSVRGSLGLYYRHVSSLFAEHGVHSSVVKFATLALDVLEDEDEILRSEATLKELWFKIFKSNAAMGKYEEAYVALMATPFADTKSKCLDLLVPLMCENGQVELLTKWSFVGLQGELEQWLSFLARNSDPLATPNYYRILYAYHMAKGDYRSAGAIMFQLGRRVGEMSVQTHAFHDLATLQCQSYLAAANSLALVEAKHAWVAVLAGEEGPARGFKRRKIEYHIDDEEFSGANSTSPAEIVELDDIRKEYTLALSRLELSKEFPELERSNLSLDGEAVVALFAQSAAFPTAFSAALTLGVDMSSLFEILTGKCVGLALGGSAIDNADWVAMNDDAATWEGTLASKGWRLLQGYLERHDDETSKYHLIVLERALTLNRTGKVPSWLIDYFLSTNSFLLIRTMLKFDRLVDAFTYSLTVIRASPSPKSTASACLPYSLFDQLLATTPSETNALSPVELAKRQAELKTALGQHVASLDKAGLSLAKNLKR